VTLEFEGQIDGVVSCNCSICSRRGSLLHFTSRDALTVTGEPELSTYTFNKHAIRHRFCKTCGILTFGEGVDPQGKRTAAVNVRCLEDFDLSTLKVHHYDGRSA
jgi:hypothetical protein